MNDSLIKKINDLPKISEVIKSYNLLAKRRLSQNYILDLNLTNHIVKISGDIKNKISLEVNNISKPAKLKIESAGGVINIIK